MKIILILSFILYSAILSAQGVLKKDYGTTTITALKQIPLCDTSNICFVFPLDEQLMNYDKITMNLAVRKLGSTDEFGNSFYLKQKVIIDFPTSKAYLDRHKDKKFGTVYIKNSPSLNRNTILTKRGLCKTSEQVLFYDEHEFIVEIQGYFKTGTESYWNERRNVYAERDVFEYSKMFCSSEPFSFEPEEGTAEKLKEQEELLENSAKRDAKREEVYEQIKKKYSEYTDLPVVGRVQALYEIFVAYELLKKELEEKEEFDKLDQVNAKLLSIESKKLKLNKKLKKQTDTELIMKEILNHEG